MRWLARAVLTSAVLAVLMGAYKAQPAADLNAILSQFNRYFAAGDDLADTSIPINAYPALWAPFAIVGEGALR